MPPRTRFLRTRVARRILVLFVTGALVPVLVMAALSFSAVRRQLQEASRDRLRRLAGNAAQSVAQQLSATEGSLHQLGRLLVLGQVGVESSSSALPPSVEALTLAAAAGGLRSVKGDLNAVPTLDSAGRAHLGQGKMLVVSAGTGELLAAVALDSANPRAGVLWARLVPDSIWGPADEFTRLSTRADFCMLGAEDRPLYCDSGRLAVAEAFRAAHVGASATGVLRHEVEGTSLFTGYRRILLGPAFFVPRWTVLVSETTRSVQHPLDSFSYSFPLALLLGISVVVLLTDVQVRRTMRPLSALQEATGRIADGDLGARVEVTGRDEFASVAGSFNRMAGRLGLMFRQIETGRAIDQAVLMARSADEAITAILIHFDELVPSRAVSVLLLEDEDRGVGQVRSRTADGREGSASVPVGPAELEWLRQEPDHRVVSGSLPFFDPPGRASGSTPRTPMVLFPLLARDQVLGALWYEPSEDGGHNPETVRRGRQIADQATVALDELHLVQELEELSWGTLRALARAIDAKSGWTSGHSERVTELAMEVGRELGLGDQALEVLNRGGLLHDIGKIGIPADILDSGRTLSQEERTLIEQHPLIGARILEPIRAFRPSLAIVSQHHERWDGGGYPEGLVGEQIDPLARILAVADAYDAMVSARPYRAPLERDEVLRDIQKRGGVDFDPRVVEAFMRVITRKGGATPIHG